jgi:Predicted membrane protein
MLKQFYVARNNKRLGPFSAAQLRRFAADGRLRPTDTVWKEGMEKPVAAAKVKSLFLAPLAPASPAGVSAPAENVPVSLPPVDAGAVEPGPSALSTAQAAPAGPIPEATTAPPGPTSPASPPPLRASDHERERQAVANGNSLRPPPEPIRKRYAAAVVGAIVVSQDGVTVYYRKKCSQCGCEDRCRSSMPIGHGITRNTFFCPKCRKNREVQLRGTT